MFDRLDKKIVVSLLLISFLVILEYPSQLMPNGLPTLLVLCSLLFIALVITYCYEVANARKGKKPSKTLLFDYTFYVYLLLSIAFIAWCSTIFDAPFVLLIFMYSIGTSLIVYIILFFLMSLATYLIYEAKNRKAGLAILAITLALLLVYFLSGYFKVVFTANDESILALYSVKALLSGANPYTTSISGLIYSSHIYNGTSFTLLSNNTIVGTLDYPSLFFLTFVPFYFLGSPTVYSLENIDLHTQAAVFVFILLVVVYFLIDKRDALKPRYLLFVFLTLILVNIISVVTLLMLAVILLAYAKINSKYSWIILGIAASIQEELWLPVLLLIAYSFNTYGVRKGARDLLGTAAVFLLFNGYFILLSPAAYIHSVFTPVNEFLPLDPSAPIGYFIFLHYSVVTDLFEKLFMLSYAGIILIFLYFNNKKAIPLLSIIPFMFLTHALNSYYYFFMVMFVVILSFKEEKYVQGALRRSISKDRMLRYSFFALLGLIFTAGVLLTYQSHLNYTKSIDLSVSNQSAYISGNTLHYSSTISYNLTDPNSTTMYVLLNVYGHGQEGFYGLFNTSLLNGSVNCSYPCAVNTNHIYLSRLNDTYHISSYGENFSAPTYVSIFLYNGKYAYQSIFIKANQS